MVRSAVVALAFSLVIYIVMVAGLGLALIGTDELVPQIMGWALMFLPLLGLWALLAELRFGWQSQRLFNQLAQLELLPGLELPKQPSGRIEPEAAQAELDVLQAAAEKEPESWQHLMRLGLMLDAGRDRKAARQSIRAAIALEQQQRQRA